MPSAKYRSKNPQKYRDSDRRYYHEVRKFRPRASRRKSKEDRCRACSIPMISTFARNGRILCEGCRSSPRIKRLINTAYTMRYYYRKQGRAVPKRYIDLRFT